MKTLTNELFSSILGLMNMMTRPTDPNHDLVEICVAMALSGNHDWETYFTTPGFDGDGQYSISVDVPESERENIADLTAQFKEQFFGNNDDKLGMQ